MSTEQQLLDKWRKLSLDEQQKVLKLLESLSQQKTTEELGWQPGFFEETAGCLQDDPIVRYPQGEYEQREPLE